MASDRNEDVVVTANPAMPAETDVSARCLKDRPGSTQ